MEFGIEIPAGKAFDAVALGLNAIDHLIVVPHYPGFNSKVPLISHTLAPGGQCATAMVTLARLGMRARYIGKVGSDDFGRLQIRSLKSEGVESTGVMVVQGADSQIAYIIVDQPSGERTVPFDNYFVGPRQDILHENVLKADEIMTEVFIPNPAPGTKQAWAKLKDRQVYDFAIVSVAAAFTVQNDLWQDGRVVLGGVAPVPYRATGIENQLKGKNIKTAIRQAAATIRTASRPMSMNAFKVDVAQNMVERTILGALA